MVARTGPSNASISSTPRLRSILFAMVVHPVQSGAKTSMSNQSTPASSRAPSPLAPRSVGANGIIIGSALGGAALLLVSLLLVLFPVWRRRRARAQRGQPAPERSSSSSTPSRESDPSAAPRPPDDPTVRPVAPSPPRRLAIDASAAPPPPRWHLEKACVHTPSGHPAITFRGDIFTNATGGGGGGGGGGNEHDRHDKRTDDDVAPRDASAASVSSTFAAEMSSLLESISLKSSYSSLRSGGLAAPPRVQARRPPAREGERGERRESGCAAARVDPAGGFAPEDGGGPARAASGPSSRPASHGFFESSGAGGWKQGEVLWRTW